MFQSFPLGDKSSVNLRGEFHVENVTSFDALPPNPVDTEKMEVDSDSNAKTPPASRPPLNGRTSSARGTEDNNGSGKDVTSSKRELSMKPDELYPIFWSLQQSFSQPKKLFNTENFAQFKKGLEATIATFKSVQHETTGRPAARAVDDNKRGTKRKRSQGDDDLANSFNPKYLTSRDLFELEVYISQSRRYIVKLT